MARTNFNGWITLQRKLMNWEFYDDARAVKLFVHLLLCAAPKSCVIDGVNLNTGEVKTSYRNLAKELKYTDREIRTYISKLIKSETIKITSSRNYSIIRITKYNFYQKSDTQSDTRKHALTKGLKGVSDTQNGTQKSDTQNNTQNNTQSDTQSDTRKHALTKGLKGVSDTQNGTQNNTQSDTQSDTPIYNNNINNNNNKNNSSSSVVVSEEEEEDILKKLKIRFFYENICNYEEEAEQMLSYWKENGWRQNNGNKINLKRLPKFQWRPRNEKGRDFARFLAVLSDYLTAIGKYGDPDYLRFYSHSKRTDDKFLVYCSAQFRDDVEQRYFQEFSKAMKDNNLGELLPNFTWMVKKS